MVSLIAGIALSTLPTPPPTVDDLAWMQGFWIGKVGADDVEETWSAPKNGSMMGMFRWFRAGKLHLMEMMTIADFDGKIVMKLKHLNRALHSFEAQNESTDFTLLRVEGSKAIWNEAKPEGGPQHLHYTRAGNKLTVRFVRPEGGKPSVANPFEFNRK